MTPVTGRYTPHMESTITGTVESVTGREVKSGTIFDVTIGGKKLSTFKAPVAEEAKALQGRTVAATVNISERNGYTNYTLLGVKLVDAGGSGLTSHVKTAAATPAAAEKKGWQPEDTARVTRLSCLSTAFQYAGAAGLDTSDALTLAQQLYSVATAAHSPQTAPEPVTAVAATETSDGIPW